MSAQCPVYPRKRTSDLRINEYTRLNPIAAVKAELRERTNFPSRSWTMASASDAGRTRPAHQQAPQRQQKGPGGHQKKMQSLGSRGAPRSENFVRAKFIGDPDHAFWG